MTEPALPNEPSLCEHDFHAWTLEQARSRAAAEMRRDAADLPEDCPYTVEQALDVAFFPGPEWDEGALLDDF